MKKLILILLASFAFSSSSNAIPKEEEPTLKSINEKCKGKDSKFLEYDEIGMKQFAKNYLRICLHFLKTLITCPAVIWQKIVFFHFHKKI